VTEGDKCKRNTEQSL